MSSERGRVVVVTGGGSGIGRGIAEAFARDGERVVLIGRDEGRLRAAAAALGSGVTWQRADVRHVEEVAAAVEEIVRQFGRIEVLINCAGVLRRLDSAMSPAEAEPVWDEVLDTNLKGALLMTLAVAPHLPRPAGRIVNISSLAAFTGGLVGGQLAYAASKTGLHGLTLALARELTPQGITVNVVAPGFVVGTRITDGLGETFLTRQAESSLAGRIRRVEDVAAAVRYLASPEASFVTAELLRVDGGRLPS